jgi:hypothetical protein
MKFTIYGMLFLCIVIQNHPACSAAALQTEWRLDYSSGDGVRIDSTNAELERYSFQTVSNLRLSPADPKCILGDLHYTRKNGHPLTLTFQSTLETYKTSHQDDAALKLTVLVYRLCVFARKSYHLPADIISTTPYEIIQNSIMYSNVRIDELSLIATATQQNRYKRPLDSSEYVQSRQITAPIKRTVLRYTYMDKQRECYPTHHLTAHHEEYELLNKQVVSTQPVAYKRVSIGTMNPSNIERITPDRASVEVTEEWLRPGIKEVIQLSRRIELPVTIETTYEHDDANLRSTKLSRFCVRHQSNTITVSQTSEIILYYKEFRVLDLTKNLNYRRPGGSIYVKNPSSPKNDDGDDGFELL